MLESVQFFTSKNLPPNGIKVIIQISVTMPLIGLEKKKLVMTSIPGTPKTLNIQIEGSNGGLLGVSNGWL